MLLITRRTGEGIVINGDIEIKIIDVRGGRVKLGLEYPVGNTVYRQEVFEKIQDENRQAAQHAGVGGNGVGTRPDQLGTVIASLTRTPAATGHHSKGATTDEPTTQTDNDGEQRDD